MSNLIKKDITMQDDYKDPRYDELLELTTHIVASYVSKNTLALQELPDVISQVYSTLLAHKQGVVRVGGENLRPAVPVKKSVTPDYIICLEDGKRLKMLKRYIRTTYKMTPEEYKAKWGLPHDYPMVAPNYAQKRSSLAKDFGLGKHYRDRDAA